MALNRKQLKAGLALLKHLPTVLLCAALVVTMFAFALVALRSGDLIAAAVTGLIASSGALAIIKPIRRGMREAERDHRRRNGLCRRCGYDLRGSRDRCPECGMSRKRFLPQ